jgi:hypothetical protein
LLGKPFPRFFPRFSTEYSIGTMARGEKQYMLAPSSNFFRQCQLTGVNNSADGKIH